MIRRSLAFALLLVAALPSSASVPPDPNTARGFAGKVYQLGDLDNVNVFNGNLTVRIPIGQSYRSGPSLAYQLVLTNNTKVWDYEGVEIDELDGLGPYRRRAIPETYSNAGLGWTLSLGRLLPPRPSTLASDGQELIKGHGYIYLGPDGAQREFFFGGCTEDGSYLRLTLNAWAEGHSIEFPDGQIHQFNAAGWLRKIRDRFDNWVDVAYTTVQCGQLTCDQWTITDGHGTTRSSRSHIVTFTNKSAKYNQANFQKVVSSVRLATFGTSTATYTFHYADDAQAGGTTIKRGGCGDLISTDSQTVGAALLNGITLPDGSTFTMQYEPSAGACSSGALARLTLPTGGALAWEHGYYFMTLQECSEANYWTTSFGGVTKRSVFPPGSTTPEAVWTYRPALTPPRPGLYSQRCNGQITGGLPYPPEELVVTITDPAGDKTAHYFSVYPPGALAGNSNFKGDEHGLPFTRKDELEAGGRALSSAVYDCPPGGCSDGGTPQRKTYVVYDGDGRREEPWMILNSRLKRQTVVYPTDTGCGSEPCFVDTDSSDFDGYGHYRRTTVSSNFPGSETRTTFTNYNPGSSATGTDAAGNKYFSRLEPWITGTYDSAWTSQGTTRRDTLAVFDTGKGVLKSLQTLRATSDAPGRPPILTAWCREGDAGARGFVTSERYLGGDLDAIAGGEPCSATRAPSHFFINHQYWFSGAGLTRHTAQYDGTAHLIADEDFDLNTGMVEKSRDAAGVETRFGYDPSGRLTVARPAGQQAATTYQYDLASVPARLTVQQCLLAATASTCTAPLTDARYYYDGLGRLIQERRKMSATQWSAQWATFDPLGRPATRSVPLTTTSGNAGVDPLTARTSWTYDFMGRVQHETRPDDSYTSFDYIGARQTRRYVADPGQSPKLRSTELYDGNGRLLSVIQPSGPTSATTTTGGNVTTAYTYDLADRLTTVTMNGIETSQVRTFSYDPAGFLVRESHPETGTVQYPQYDARGHARKRIPGGGHSIFKQQYTYDAAERLVQVDTGAPFWTEGATHVPEYRLTKAFRFANANDGENKKKGKLEEATRENYAACVGTACQGDRIRVVETYGYDAVGRTNSRTTAIYDATGPTSPLIKSINQSFAYNELGLPSSLSYPVCTGCGVPPGTNPRRDIALTYTQGLLQSVDGYVSRLTYAATGTPTAIQRIAGGNDSIALDSSGRPRSFTFANWSSCGVPPAIDIQPVSQTISAGSTATVEVTTSGTSPQYQWYEADGSLATAIPGATLRTYTTPVLTAAKSYFVRVTNACRSVDSVTVTVTATCTAPAISAPPQSRTIASGTSRTLTVSATGTSLTYQWYRGTSGNTSQLVGTSSPSYTTPALSVTTSYWVRVTGQCGSVDSSTATLTVPLPAPAGLIAQMESPTSVRLTWSPVSGAARYEVWRRSGAGTFMLVTVKSGSPWIDTGRTSGATYVYRLRALDANDASASGFSNPDLATLIPFSSILPGVTVFDDAQWHQLLAALNALRAANGDGALSWTGILPADVAAPAPGIPILRAHLDALRQRFTSALQALGVPSPAYTDPDLTTKPLISVIHITELQQRAQ
jgi:YD repeat-containing protein